jgi:Fur family ferric uptake transcriptional regulator
MTVNREDWLSALQASGCRLTTVRRAVVETMTGSGRALTPVEVYDAARERCPGLGLVSVYRTLEKLEELGLVQRVHQAKGCQAFITAGEGHQHLLICSRCGKATLFDGDDLAGLFQRVAEQTGYKVEDHWLELFGLCKACQSAS